MPERQATEGSPDTATSSTGTDPSQQPEGARSRHPSFVWCFLAFLVVASTSRHNDSLNLPVGPDRLLFGAAAVLFLLDRRYSLSTLRVRAVHVVAVAVLAWAALSAFAHGELLTNLGFFALLDRLAIPYLLFAVAPLLFRRPEDRLLLLQTMAFLGLYLGVTAVFEIFGPHVLVFPRYIVDPAVGIQYGRARGPFAESEANGMTLIACGYCALVLIRVAPSTWWRRLAVLAAGAAALGALLTLTRSVWLGLALSLLAVAVLDRRYRRMIAAGAVLTAVVIGALLLGSSQFSDQVTGRAGANQSLDDRRNTNAAAVRAIEAHPITGVGWVRFIEVSGTYVRQAPLYPVTHVDIEVHNVVLARAAELGIPGGALWVLSVLLGPGFAATRRPTTEGERTWRLVALGTSVAWLVPVLTSPVPYPLPNFLVWLFAGLALATFLVRPQERAGPAGDPGY